MRIRAKYVAVVHATAVNVAERWKAQYLRGNSWIPTVRGSSQRIYDELCALGPTPDIHKVAEIIGNKSWSFITCSSCNSDVKEAVQFTDSEFHLCETCLREAVQVLSES